MGKASLLMPFISKQAFVKLLHLFLSLIGNLIVALLTGTAALYLHSEPPAVGALYRFTVTDGSPSVAVQTVAHPLF